MKVKDGIEVRAPGAIPRLDEILTKDVLAFIAKLERALGPRRRELLAARDARQARLDAGEKPDFLAATKSVRDGAWKVAPVPADLRDRRVEITGPTDKKMVINALNSGANVFMADFEDSNAPTFENCVVGQANLSDAIDRKIDFTSPEGKKYALKEKTAVLLVRPRGWHLNEKHVLVDGRPVSASLFDFGVYFFRNHARLKARGTGPYFYLPKMESHLEARLWNDAFVLAQEHVGIPRGTIKATVLIETILAAFEMEEILHELRDHSGGLNAGRWDYLFSIIKKMRATPLVLPDRVQIGMTVPFMRAYTELMVRTCHKRGAHAIGGMAAFIPSRKDAKVNETALAKVREDKQRESSDGFDGTWVAHPDLVPVAKEVFDAVLGSRPNQLEKTRDDVRPDAAALLRFEVPGGQVTEAGLRTNVSVGIQYLESWLRGTGAVGINNLMEDAATAEISRSQVWQWVQRGKFDRERVKHIIEEELERIRGNVGDAGYSSGKFGLAAELFERVALSSAYVEFLTVPAYEHLD